jgi:hypothetical protein
LEPYGMMILIALLFLLPVVGAQVGVDLNIISYLVAAPTEAILRAILWLTGNGRWCRVADSCVARQSFVRRARPTTMINYEPCTTWWQHNGIEPSDIGVDWEAS